jgi:hypothetical protein
MLVMIHFNLSSLHFILNAVYTIETGWGTQLKGNCNATVGFCRANVDMIALGFNSIGSVNNPVCWSFIQHRAEGKKTYTLTVYELQKAVIPLLKANTTKECPFTTCLKELMQAPMFRKKWRAIYIVMESCCSIKLSVISSRDGLPLLTKYVEWIQTLAPVISQVTFLFIVAMEFY